MIIKNNEMLLYHVGLLNWKQAEMCHVVGGAFHKDHTGGQTHVGNW